MARLSTHVLDTANGRPAAGVRVRLYSCIGDSRQLLKTVATNTDGRAEVATDALEQGVYELVFSVSDYFGLPLNPPPFLGEVTVRFGVAGSATSYHVPLLVSPYGYSTYRGS